MRRRSTLVVVAATTAMGAYASVPDRAEKERLDEIDRQIEEDSRRFRKECKILLLGECLSHSVRSGSWDILRSFLIGVSNGVRIGQCLW